MISKPLANLKNVRFISRPDATLQSIVYKLVPGLYEKELLRRRAFYKLRKEEAQLATPEQRGDDTEHLIFGPNENISLMLEYSDNEYVPWFAIFVDDSDDNKRFLISVTQVNPAMTKIVIRVAMSSHRIIAKMK